jgi:leader peptidase (prepilin peptidase)/N-methyltransferase
MPAHDLHDAARALALLALLIPVVAIDLRSRRIPNRLTSAGAIAALALALLWQPGALPERLLAAIAGGGVLLLAAVARPDGMGLGDVKLTAVLGLFLGRTVVVALLVGLLAATVAGGAVALRGGVRSAGDARRWRGTAIPLGPFLALGALVALAVGDRLLDWYLPGAAG